MGANYINASSMFFGSMFNLHQDNFSIQKFTLTTICCVYQYVKGANNNKI